MAEELVEPFPDAALLGDEPEAEAPASPVKPKKKFDRAIVEGPLTAAVWKLAWPAVLTNLVSGLQGWVDQIMVGNLIGYHANAAIGASFQIFLLVITFVGSIFIGMSVLISRFAGANEPEKVNRTVYQAFLTALVLSLFVLAPVGYVLSPTLLDLVNATPAVKAEALPFLRTMFVFSIGMLLFFMLGGALRAAGDARTPLRLGAVMTALNIAFNVVLISGAGPIPALKPPATTDSFAYRMGDVPARIIGPDQRPDHQHRRAGGPHEAREHRADRHQAHVQPRTAVQVAAHVDAARRGEQRGQQDHERQVLAEQHMHDARGGDAGPGHRGEGQQERERPGGRDLAEMVVPQCGSGQRQHGDRQQHADEG